MLGRYVRVFYKGDITIAMGCIPMDSYIGCSNERRDEKRE